MNDALDRSTEAPLFPDAESRELRSWWDAIQAEFVDEPKESVKKAASGGNSHSAFV